MKRLVSSILIFLIVLAMFTMLAPKTSATENVVFQDDFESYAIDTFPSAGGWNIIWNGAGNQYQVITSSYYSSPTKSLQLMGSLGWSVVVKKDFSSSSNLIGYETQMMTTEGRSNIAFCNIPIETWGRYYATVSLGTDGFIWACEHGNEETHKLQPYTPYTWYKIRVLIDRSARVYDVWIDDVLKGHSIPIADDPWEILSLQLQVGWVNNKGYFDDVKVFEVGETPSPTGLVGYWNFDEGSGNTVSDYSGNGNVGTLSNGPVWVEGRVGEALSFDGTDDYIRVEASSSLDVTSEVTVEAWIYARNYVDSTGMVSHIISRCDSSGGHVYVLSIYPDSGKVSFSAGPTEHPSNADLPLNAWTHLTMTYDGSAVCLYMNGTFDSSYSETEPLPITDNWLAIGCKPTDPVGGVGTYAYFDGIVDDARIYNRALSQQEIQADMGEPAPPQTGSISGVVFYLDSEGDVITIPGAAVSLTYTSYVTTTDDQGRYSLTNIPFDRWMMSCNVPDYLERNEYATINSSYPNANVHFCMKAQMMDNLKEKAVTALDSIEGWLQTEAQHIDNFADKYMLQLAEDLVRTGFDIVLSKVFVPLDAAIVEKYFLEGLISSTATTLVNIINEFGLGSSVGIYAVNYASTFGDAKQRIEQLYRPIDSASMFKCPQPIDPEMKAYIRDVSDQYENIATKYLWSSATIDGMIRYLEEIDYLLRYVDMIGEALMIAGEMTIIVAPATGVLVGGVMVVGGAFVGIGFITRTTTLIVRTRQYLEGYGMILVPLFFRTVETAEESAAEVESSLSDAFEKVMKRNEDPESSIPSIQVVSGENPAFIVKNTFASDISVNCTCIAELYFPELVGIVEETSYLFKYEEPAFLMSSGEERGFNIKYPNEAVQWIDSVRARINSPTRLEISLVVYANYGVEQGAEYAARKEMMTWSATEYPANYNEFELHSTCDLHVYDSYGRHTGLNYSTNWIDFEIPHSLCYQNESQRIVILDPSGTYTVRLIGTDNGEYHLNLKSVFETNVTNDTWINGTVTNEQTLDSHIYVEPTGEIRVIPSGDIVSEFGIVDIFDIAVVALAFGSAPSDPNWNPVADINFDRIVDIFDIAVVALHFGETG